MAAGGRRRRRRRRAGLGLAAAAVALATLATASPAVAAAADPVAIEGPADFGRVSTALPAEQVLTVVNRSAGPVTVTSVSVDDGAFLLAGDGCTGEALAPSDRCAVTVRFVPPDLGDHEATLTVAATTDGAPVSASRTLTGTGVAGTSPDPSPPTVGSPGGRPPQGERPPPPTTTVPPTTTPEPPEPPDEPVDDDDRARLARCETRARRSTVSYVPSQQMEVGRTTEVRVVASVEGAPTTTTDVPTTVETAELRCEVQAELRGRAFAITPDGFRPASFLDRPSIDWSWEVEPRAAGRHRLTVEIRSVAVIDGRRIEGAGGRLFTSDIDVTTQPEGLGARIERITGALVDHPLVRGFGSLLAVGGALAAGWRWVLKREWPTLPRRRSTEA